MEKPSASVNTLLLAASIDTHTDTKGGFKDTDEKELAVKPLGVPRLSKVVMTVIPVRKNA